MPKKDIKALQKRVKKDTKEFLDASEHLLKALVAYAATHPKGLKRIEKHVRGAAKKMDTLAKRLEK